MKIIALDLGSHMALAHNGFDDVVVSDSCLFMGSRAERAGLILQWLDKRFEEIYLMCGRMDAVVYERPFARGFDATRCGWGIAGIIEALAEKHGMAVLDITPADVKKFALGKIKRTKLTSAERRKKAALEKELMLDAAQKWGYKGSNEHEADAYCLLQCALSTAAITPPKAKR